jgi:hypothetical protein
MAKKVYKKVGGVQGTLLIFLRVFSAGEDVREVRRKGRILKWI